MRRARSFASQASAALVEQLSQRRDVFQSVAEPGASSLFRRDGLMFPATDEVERVTGALTQAQPLVQVLVTDPSLRGVVQVMLYVLAGVQSQQLTLNDTVYPLTMAAAPLEAVVLGRPAHFSWSELMRGKPPEPMDLRRFIEVQPVLDYSALEPGPQGDAGDQPGCRRSETGTRYSASVAADRTGRARRTRNSPP